MRKYLVILSLLCICIAGVGGTWFGVYIEQNTSEAEELAAESISSAVAIVNQDLGTEVGKSKVNYANAIIENMGKTYTVVSASVAEDGLKNDEFCAVITFPPDFSENIVSINDASPKQANLDFDINPRLSEARYIDLYNELISEQQNMNNSIAFAYVETVYQELHSAQDEVGELFDNDKRDMVAVEKVSLTNYVELLDLGDIPKVEFNLRTSDYDGFIRSVQSIGDDMNRVYVDSYAEATKDYADIKNEIATCENDISKSSKAWQDEIDTWAVKLASDTKEISEYRKKLNEWKKESEEYRVREAEYANATEIFKSDVEQYLQRQVLAVNTYRDSNAVWSHAVVNSLSGINAELQEIVLDINAINGQSDMNEDVMLLCNDIISRAMVVQNIVNSGIGTAPEPYMIQEAVPVFIAIRPEALGNVPEQVAELVYEMPPMPSKELKDSLKQIVSVSAKYNPDDYLNEKTRNQAQQNIEKYKGHLREVESITKSNDMENLNTLNKAYGIYNSHVGELRQNICDVHGREQEILANSILGLSDTLIATSGRNHELMDSFATRMPNSRVNSTVNAKVVEDTIQPVAYTFDYIRNMKTKVDITLWFEILLSLLTFVLVTDLIFILKSYKKVKN